MNITSLMLSLSVGKTTTRLVVRKKRQHARMQPQNRTCQVSAFAMGRWSRLVVCQQVSKASAREGLVHSTRSDSAPIRSFTFVLFSGVRDKCGTNMYF